MITLHIDTEIVNGKKYYTYQLPLDKRIVADNLQDFISMVMYIVHSVDIDKHNTESGYRLYNLSLEDTAIIELDNVA